MTNSPTSLIPKTSTIKATESFTDMSDSSTAYAIISDEGLADGYLLVEAISKLSGAQINIVRSIKNGELYVRKKNYGSDLSFERSGVEATKQEIYLASVLPPTMAPELIHQTSYPEGRKALLHAYYNGGDLRSLLKAVKLTRSAPLPEVFAWHLLAEMAKILAFLHWGLREHETHRDRDPKWMKITHGNLRPENIFLHWVDDEPLPKILLGNFNYAKYHPRTYTRKLEVEDEDRPIQNRHEATSMEMANLYHHVLQLLCFKSSFRHSGIRISADRCWAGDGRSSLTPVYSEHLTRWVRQLNESRTQDELDDLISSVNGLRFGCDKVLTSFDLLEFFLPVANRKIQSMLQDPEVLASIAAMRRPVATDEPKPILFYNQASAAAWVKNARMNEFHRWHGETWSCVKVDKETFKIVKEEGEEGKRENKTTPETQDHDALSWSPARFLRESLVDPAEYDIEEHLYDH